MEASGASGNEEEMAEEAEEDGEEQKPAVAQELAVAVAVGKKEPPDEGPPAQPIKTECKEEALEEAPDKAQGSAEAGAEPAPEGVVKVEKKEGGGGSGGKAPSTKGSGAPQDSDSSATCSADEVDEPEGGDKNSTRPVLPRPPTISNPPPLISSSKHPSVLDRQGLSVQLHIPYSEHAKVPVGPLAMGLAPALDPKKLAPFSSVKQEQLSPRGQAGPPESLGVPTAQETSVLRGLYRGGNKLAVSLMGKLRPGERKPLTSTRFVPRGTPADVLYKGTITRIMGEDSPSRLDRGREDGLPKGHVIYEGKKGHVLSYDGGMSVSKEDGRSSSGPAHETAAPKRTYDMMEGRVGRAIASGSIEGLMGRAIPPERHSPHHLKEQHHIRGSITQGTPAPHPHTARQLQGDDSRVGGGGTRVRWEPDQGRRLGRRADTCSDGDTHRSDGAFLICKESKMCPLPIPRTPFIEHLLCAWRWPQRCLYATLRDGVEKEVPWAGGLGVRYLGSPLVGSWRAAAANPG
ncbi:Nuclear receptor corepressor 2 [Myotis davidii]|uniref:Nuclear receptor corepressor 2 n=1 Tax=Myotis davidii TaxID=225400 RepID=L5LKI5_MYODS|nr:Nuclear receptor corepressor 2 [Myotis davidii]